MPCLVGLSGKTQCKWLPLVQKLGQTIRYLLKLKAVGLILCVFTAFKLNASGAAQSFCHSVGATAMISTYDDVTCIL